MPSFRYLLDRICFEIFRRPMIFSLPRFVSGKVSTNLGAIQFEAEPLRSYPIPVILASGAPFPLSLPTQFQQQRAYVSALSL